MVPAIFKNVFGVSEEEEQPFFIPWMFHAADISSHFIIKAAVASKRFHIPVSTDAMSLITTSTLRPLLSIAEITSLVAVDNCSDVESAVK